MKNPLVIVIILVVICGVLYMVFGKGTSKQPATTTTTTNQSGIASLFNTGAITSLFGNLGGSKNNTPSTNTGGAKPLTKDQQDAANIQTNLALGFAVI